MSTDQPTTDLTTVLNSMLTAIGNVLSGIANAIAQNATLIGTVVVMGVAFYALYRYGGRVFRLFTEWLRF